MMVRKEFSMEIAGFVAAISPQCESTRHYFREYLTERAPDFSFAVTREAMDFEQAFSLEEARQEGIRPRMYDDPHLERAAIQRAFAEYLFDRDVLLLHGSTVALDGKAYLFTAKCGIGKSTHTRLWRQVFGQRAVMVNDDKPFLKITPDGILACGSPWSGKHGLSSNICVPLQGICILERGAENVIRPFSPAEALPMLLHQAYCPVDGEKAAQQRDLVERLAASVALWHMDCTKDPQAAIIAHAAMANP